MALTDTALKALKPKDKPYTVADERGLYVEVFPTGGIVWRYRYRLNGKLEKLTLGKYPALTLKNARIKRDEAARRRRWASHRPSRSSWRRWRLPTRPPWPTSASGSSGRSSRRTGKDLTIPRRYFDKSIVPAIGTKPVRDVTTEDVRAIIWKKKDEGFDAAAGAVRGVLKRLFDYAMTAGLVTTNPVLALPMRHVHKAKSRERALSPDEIRIFLKAAFESNIRRQFKIGLHLILLTMVRKSELLLARWEHVDFEQRGVAHPGRTLQDRQAAHRVPIAPGCGVVQGAASSGRRQRTGYTGPWQPDQALRPQRDQQRPEGGAERPGHPSVHDPRSSSHCVHAASRERLVCRRRREGAEPHDRRRARRLQPRRVRDPAARDAAILGGLPRTVAEHGTVDRRSFPAGSLSLKAVREMGAHSAART